MVEDATDVWVRWRSRS